MAYSLLELQAIAGSILAEQPDPSPRWILMRDVLHLPGSNQAMAAARTSLERCALARRLQASQDPEGTWGRFHTRDSRLIAEFPTSELAVQAALEMGLDQDSPVISRFLPVLLEHVAGRKDWPDRHEVQYDPDAWPIWVRHISAAVLAEIDPLHPALEPFRQIWLETVAAAFKTGAYDRNREAAAFNSLTGCRMRAPMPFNRKYPLMILSAAGGRLPETLERRALEFVLDQPEGIYYTCPGPIRKFRLPEEHSFWAWLRALRILGRFSQWPAVGLAAGDHVWNLRSPAGRWVPPAGTARRPASPFPLSETWRRSGSRSTDASAFILALLAAAR